MGKKYDAGYDQGHYDGRELGWNEGFTKGLIQGRKEGKKQSYTRIFDSGFQAGKAHAHKFPVDMEPQKEGDRAGQVIFDEIQPGSPLDNLYQALKQEEDS